MPSDLLFNGEYRYIKSKVGRQSPCPGSHDPIVIVSSLQNERKVRLGYCTSRQVKRCGLPIDLYVRFNWPSGGDNTGQEAEHGVYSS